MKHIKGIIFDYGGTLDTNGVHWFHIFHQVYAEYFPQVDEKQLREAYVYAERYLATHRIIEPTDDFLAMLEKKVTIQLSQLTIGNSEMYQSLQHSQLSVKIASRCDELVRKNLEHSRKVLDTLSARYPLVLVSNFYGNIHSVLRSYGLENYFKEIVESAVVGIRKPNPQIFSLGITALGLHANEVLVIGDSYSKDIVPAHSLGCHTAWLKGQGWDTADEPSDTSCADITIENICDIVQAVLSYNII